MSLRTLRRTWNQFGKQDPLWAILTHTDKSHGRWEVDDFFATGEAEVASLFELLHELAPGWEPGAALDFGCGVGRLSQALAERVPEVFGVDLSDVMIEKARRLERERGADRSGSCTFEVNRTRDLHGLGERRFDLIYSSITLQHMRPRLQLGYLREFGRLLSPGGLMVVQIPLAPRRPLNWRGRTLRLLLLGWKRHLNRRPVMDMFGQPVEVVRATLESAGCEVLGVVEDNASGSDWISQRYIARRT
ncbi:MAG: class I SAM-dependent methyltransferase [Planctomycetota bacterium]